MVTSECFLSATRARWGKMLLRQRTGIERFAIMFAIVIGSLGVSWAMYTFIPDSHLFSVNLAGSILAAAICGLVPGILAGLLEAIAVDYFWIEPARAVFDSWFSFVRVGLYIAFAALSSFTVSLLRQALASEAHARRIAEEASRAREGVLAIVSHDLRGPLTAVKLNASLIRRQLLDEGDWRLLSKAENVISAADRMNRQIDDLLDAVKVERGMFAIRSSSSSLYELVESALDTISPAAEKKKIAVRVSLATDLPQVWCDFGRMLQVLTNLLGNAIKFSADGSVVVLEVFLNEAKEVVFRIKDSGPGVPPEDRENVFHRFWQSKETAYKGTGLGLFISKAIVQAHGGRIWIEDEHGKGTVFYFALPIAYEAESLRQLA